MEVELMATKRYDDDRRRRQVNIEQSPSGGFEGRVLQYDLMDFPICAKCTSCGKAPNRGILLIYFSLHMARMGELRFTKRTVGEVNGFGLVVMNRGKLGRHNY